MSILSGNQVELLSETDQTIDRLVGDIEGAKHHVHLLYYIFSTDRTGVRVVDALHRAAGRGVNVKGLQLTTFLVGSLMTAIVVSVVGPIGFVGLIVPHAVRAITGSRHRLLMPVSAMTGGAFLCLCDIVARKVVTGEFPIGIVTSLIGGPFFLYLLMRRHFTDWEA